MKFRTEPGKNNSLFYTYEKSARLRCCGKLSGMWTVRFGEQSFGRESFTKVTARNDKQEIINKMLDKRVKGKAKVKQR
jgi:hypothetical protein